MTDLFSRQLPSAILDLLDVYKQHPHEEYLVILLSVCEIWLESFSGVVTSTRLTHRSTGSHVPYGITL